MVVIFTTGSRRATSLVFGFLIGAGWMVSVARSRKLGTLAAARPGESICQFSRSFDLRHFDTVLIRAVYETVREQVGRSLGAASCRRPFGRGFGIGR